MLDHRYQTFVLLCKNKSYTKTAQELFVSQPAVSQQIKSLENELQLKLVEYHHPHLLITDAGLRLAHFIETSQHQEQKLIHQLQQPHATSQLKFGVTHSVSIFMAPDLIKQWQPLFHQIQCVVSNTRDILNQIDNGELDFAILEGNFDKNNYGSRIVAKENFIGVTRANSPLAHQGQLELEDLLSEPLILREEGSGTRAIFTSWAKAFNVHQTDFAQTIELGSTNGIINLLQTTGVSFMYESLVSAHLEHQSLIKLPLQGLQITRPISLVYAKDSFFEQDYQRLF